jgi:tRNA(fMet)-specific endonuclease VapC
LAFVVDTSAVIGMERSGHPIDVAFASDPDFKLAISALTVSELLEGVYRAPSGERREQRRRYIETVLDRLPIFDFNLAVAWNHLRLRADLSQTGTPIGAHDAIIAATALTIGAGIITENVREFERVPGIRVIRPPWSPAAT